MRVVEGTATVEDLDAFLGDLDEVAADTGCTVQAFDARYVLGREHLERALTLADRARERGENVARERGMEVLLYAAGRRQIDRALELGVDEGETPVAVLVAAEPAGDPERQADGRYGRGEDEGADGEQREAAAADRVRSLLEPSETLGVGDADPERVRAFFEVGEAERRATAGRLQDIVLERVALLDVEK